MNTLVVLAVLSLSALACAESDVYWRQWKGTIPEDAVVGAYRKTETGSEVPIYMAQAFHKNGFEAGILPGQIFEKSRAVLVSASDKVFRYNNHIKILCAKDPSILTWVPRYETGVLGLAENDCVLAGFEGTVDSFFARANYEDEAVIGKFTFYRKEMYFPFYSEERHTKNCEILCYTKAVETKRIVASTKKEAERESTHYESDEELPPLPPRPY